MAAKNGRVNLTAATADDIIQAGLNGGQFNVEILNASGSTAIVQLGVSTASQTFQPEGKLLEALILPANDQVTFKQIVLEASQYIVGESDTTNVNMVAMGFDE